MGIELITLLIVVALLGLMAIGVPLGITTLSVSLVTAILSAAAARDLVQELGGAEALGEAGRPAVNAIDDFIAGWEHAQED